MVKRAVVIYHDNCNDGFGAAFAFWKWHAQNYDEHGVAYHAASYGNEPPYNLIDKDTDVYILDFSYAPEVLVSLADVAAWVKLLDHHKTAMEAWDKYLASFPVSVPMAEITPNNMSVVFDMTRSGAMMAYSYFAPYKENESCMFRLIQDRDLWKFELGATKEFHAYLSVQNKDFLTWNTVFTGMSGSGRDDICSTGQLLLRQFEKQCEEIVRIGKREVYINGIIGLECNCPPMFASDVGNILAKESGTFGHTWMNDDEGSKHSLRSCGDFDVSAIAKIFGGGGHKNAAGFKLAYNSFQDAELAHKFITWKLRPAKP